MGDILDAKVSMSVKQFFGCSLALIVIAAGALWAVLAFTIGGITDDVADIRQNIQELRQNAKSDTSRGIQTDDDLKNAVSSIEKNIAVMAQDMGYLRRDFSVVAETNNKILAQYTEVNNRLDKIEAAVTFINQIPDKQ